MSNVGLNRFLDVDRYYGSRHDLATSRHRGVPFAMPQSAADRVLVVLIENGGIDLGLPDLVNRLISEVPGASSLVSDEMRAQIVTGLRDWLTTNTDHLLESAELVLNRYTGASPDKYGSVVVLRDSTGTYAELKNALFTASRAGKLIDLVILTHGGPGSISAGGPISADDIRRLATDYGGPLNIRSVYMMNCVGSSLNQAWLDAGARTSAGTHENNYLPEPTTFFFFSAWKEGQTFEAAVTGAYRRTIDAMNGVLRSIVTAVVPLAGAMLAGKIDVSTLSFVVSSRPEVVGAGTLTIGSDTLPPASSGTSSGQSLVTTVIPQRLVPRLVARTFSVARTLSPSGRTFVATWETAGPQLDHRISEVERFLSDRIAQPLNQQQVDALASFGVGVGARAFTHSTLMRLLESGDLASVPGEIRKWTKVRKDGRVVDSEQLLERRRAEAELFAGNGSGALAVPASREVREYAYQQNPAMIAGIAVADAIQIGLAGAAIVQSQINAFPGGSLQVTYDSQQRMLTPQARLDMPGAATPRNTYTRNLFWFPSIRLNAAQALIRITWDGNAYGEIGTPTITKDLDQTTDWTKSSASVNIRAVTRIPEGSDPRTYPLWYHYEGSFDPIGNGQWDFNGNFEINAFGAIAFHDHRNASRSLMDFAISGVNNDSWKGEDVTAVVPTIPADQMAYLRAHVPA